MQEKHSDEAAVENCTENMRKRLNTEDGQEIMYRFWGAMAWRDDE